LVKEGVITSYRTNFDSVTASLAPHVAVTANVVTLSGKKGFDPQRTSEIRRRVARELRALVPDVIVSVREAPANPT
jgi:hypothetical protein